MIKQILKSTDPRLREKSKPVQKVDKKVLSIISDLKDTLRIQEDPEGVGLAAPQIGKNVQVFIIKINDGLKTIINPKVLWVSKFSKKNVANKKKKPKILEGCLSLPHYYGPLKRNESIKLTYLNEEARKVTEIFTSFSAQIVQHEIDHLNGVFFTDRLFEQKAPLYEYINGEWEKVELPQ